MIKSLQIKNIQSHEKTILEFDKGVNVIIGSSNQGKSAILRSFYWLRYNRPLGTDILASHWIVNDNGNLNGVMSVKIENDEHVVERRRTKDENQYIVDGEVLNVVKTDVPEQVDKVLCLSDTNIQKQLDAPFLLSKSDGEIAKYFNQMVNLDIIDKVLTNAESSRRKIKSEIEIINSSIEQLKEKFKSFYWIDYSESLLNEYENVEKEINSKDAYLDILDTQIDNVDELEKTIKELSDIINKSKLIDELEEYERKIDKLKESINDLESNYNLISLKLNEVYDFTSQKKWIAKIESISVDYSLVDNLSDSIDNYERLSSIIEDNEKTIKDYKKLLPKTCPLCGHELENEI